MVAQAQHSVATTSDAERTNLSVRLFTRRFTRCTPGHSKKLENLRHAVALFVWHFNFVRKHGAHGFTPAFAGGVAPKKPMKIEELFEDWERLFQYPIMIAVFFTEDFLLPFLQFTIYTYFMRLFYKKKEFIPILNPVVKHVTVNIENLNKSKIMSIIAYSTLSFPKEDKNDWFYLEGPDLIPMTLVDTHKEGAKFYANLIES